MDPRAVIARRSGKKVEVSWELGTLDRQDEAAGLSEVAVVGIGVYRGREMAALSAGRAEGTEAATAAAPKSATATIARTIRITFLRYRPGLFARPRNAVSFADLTPMTDLLLRRST